MLVHASLADRLAYHEAGHATAAIAFGIPIISVTIGGETPAMHRGRYVPPHDLGVECMATLCFAGPAAEELFCGPITDGSDRIDHIMAREYLSRTIDPLFIGAELARHRDAAERLVATPWARDRIQRIAATLLKHGTLMGDEIDGLTV